MSSRLVRCGGCGRMRALGWPCSFCGALHAPEREQPPETYPGGWRGRQLWLRARELLFGRPRPENPAPRPRCPTCSSLVSNNPGDRCSVCGEPLPLQAGATPESSLEGETR